eukprot:CAMPEP_0119546624 /NCGR_PEP_ID=MMETSP1352-20130426/961_1 /TAXON_ID=265584 /ORGANISM="Stauroneis constricta, Strain CCMP1120" /LENGTH=333 /DNA_ID=CAMNT_0007591345 /DNA_START=234 /DNA_END=1235 /DNA_ORIENTATION=+
MQQVIHVINDQAIAGGSIMTTHSSLASLGDSDSDTDTDISANANADTRSDNRRRRQPTKSLLNDDSTLDTASITSSENSVSTAPSSSSASASASKAAQKKNTSSNSNSNNKNSNIKNKNGKNKKNKKGKYNKQKQQEAKLTQADKARYVAMDCEMVGVGPRGYQSMLARVTCIGWDGNVLLDEFVKPTQPVTNYRTHISGITEQDLTLATMTIEECRTKVLSLLDNKILIGHALKNDMKVLQIQHPWHQIRDTGKYHQFMQKRADGILWPRKLKDLAQTRLQRHIQQDGRPHDPYEDAKAALDLYRLVRCNWESAICYKLEKTKSILAGQQQT